MWGVIGSFAKALVSPAATIINGWQTRKSAKLESDIQINTATTAAKIKKVETGQNADIAWEKTSLDQSGWKDEFWTIVIAIPMVMCFMPFMVQFVVAGFAALAQTPVWYQGLVGVAVASAFGCKQVINFMKMKKGD